MQTMFRYRSGIRHGLHNRRSRRRGVALVYFALGMVVFISAAALAVDMGSLYNRKSAAQEAADAAALAGAYQFAHFAATPGAPTYAHDSARYYARLNGYRDDLGQATVTTTYPVPGRGANNFRVRVSRPNPCSLLKFSVCAPLMSLRLQRLSIPHWRP